MKLWFHSLLPRKIIQYLESSSYRGKVRELVYLRRENITPQNTFQVSTVLLITFDVFCKKLCELKNMRGKNLLS